MSLPAWVAMQASLLDAEFEKLGPALSETLGTINGQITQGFSPEQIALGAIGLPLAYQVIKIVAGYAELHRDGIAGKREQMKAEHAAKLERDQEIFRAGLRAGQFSAAAPEPSRPVQ